MIKTIDNFLKTETIDKLYSFIGQSLGKPVWRNNLAWNAEIRKGSSPVWILPIKEDLSFEIKNTFIEHGFNINNLKITVQFYCWTPLSYIPFHNDDQKILSATIYLNKHWDKNFGGLFLYEEENKIQGIVPAFNKCITNDSFIEHAVTLTTIDSPYRETLQIFFNNV